MADLNAVLRIRAVDKATGALKAVNRRMRKLTDNIKKSHKAARGMSAEYTKMAGSIQLASQGVQSAGRRMLEAIRGTAREAVSFDDAMADVRKVVEFDSPKGLAQFSERISVADPPNNDRSSLAGESCIYNEY